MTIEKSGVVDGMGISKSDGKVVLTISDHLDWQDGKSHFDLLEKKINSYLGFVKNGQLHDVLPVSKWRLMRIEVVYQYEPSEVGSRFLAEVKQQLQSMGIELVCKRLSENY
jgi:hypothetical protein